VHLKILELEAERDGARATREFLKDLQQVEGMMVDAQDDYSL
jgi:hypothetical protein